MAYYSSPYSSASDYGESNFESFPLNYDYSQNVYEYSYNNQPYCYGYYDPTPSLNFYPNYYYPVHQSYQTISYSATTPTDPKSFEYDPNYGMTQLVISYSKLEDAFNETAFDEYDPTPYGGGYDIAETYGKPLPPSDVICYPPFGSSSISDSVPVPAGAIVPLPIVGDEKEIKPQSETAGQVVDEMPQSQDSGRGQTSEVVEVKSNDDALEESERSDHDEDDYYSGSGGDYGDNGYSGVQCIDEYEKQVPPQYPSGYGLEAMDICESLFGYWPCLSRMKEKRGEHCCEAVRGNNCYQDNMWKGTADYLFGNPNPYVGAGEVVYGYERHHPTQGQTQYLQIEYTADESW